MLQRDRRFVGREYITFPFWLTPRSTFYVGRSAWRETLHFRDAGVWEMLQEAPELLGLTSIPSGLMYKESGGGRLKPGEARP